MAKKGGSFKHVFYGDYEDFHKSVKTYVNGACLTGHLSKYQEKDSCSYRWQGLKKAKESPGRQIYNSHCEEKCTHGVEGTSHGWPKVISITRGQAGKIVAAFKKQVFDGVEKQFVEVSNFTNGWRPYPNQVHHILPKELLADAINETSGEDAELKDVICLGLLEEKYNINYKDNMLILPTESSDSCKIGLPTHEGNHPGYTAKVKKAVMRALRPYLALKDQEEDHDVDEPLDLKNALEDISDVMYEGIINYRPKILAKCKNTEVKLNNLPRTVFANLKI